jgi:hypothetical protein
MLNQIVCEPGVRMVHGRSLSPLSPLKARQQATWASSFPANICKP